MSTGVITWSQTAASNSTADTNVNWAEGQAPSSVNDSARAMMASVAKWRDDMNGLSLTTGGTSTAYTLTSNQVFASLSAMNGAHIKFILHTTNGAAPTLNVDGLGAKSLVTTDDGTPRTLLASMIPTGSIVAATYISSASEWRLTAGHLYRAVIPGGTAMLFLQNVAPTGWTGVTTFGQNHALRIVGSSGGGGTAGSSAFSSIFAARTILQAHLPSYNLSAGSLTASAPALTVNGNTAQGWDGTTKVAGAGASAPASSAMGAIAVGGITIGGSVPSGGSGTAIDFAVQYADAITCTKDTFV